MRTPAIGANVTRREAREKVTGRARYVGDVTYPGMLYGVTVRSPIPRGTLEGLRFLPGVPWEEIVVVTAADIPALARAAGGGPGANVVALIVSDQPCLAAREIRHAEEPIAVLAHPDHAVAERARSLVEPVLAPLPPVLTIDDALAKNHVVYGDANLLKEYRIEKGDVEEAFARADRVIEGTYETAAQEQLYIETNGVVARFDPAQGVTVSGSLQCPFYVQKALTTLLDVPPERARVVQLETGGGFGGKEEYPSILAAHAALLAIKSGRPVKMVYDREEDMAATTKRHPSRTRHRTAFDRDGTLLAMDIDFVLDGGAYATLSQVVLSRGAIHATGPYHVPNVRVRARAVATCAPPHGAFRGFGAPQSLFAVERHLDVCARALGIEPAELRRRNFVRPGQTLATGQLVRDEIDMDALLTRALAESGWVEKRRRFAAENAAGGPIRRGMGLAAFMHGTGFTGSGEKYLQSVAAVEATAEGRVRVLASSTEIGQGTNTVFTQIAADALRISCDTIDVARPDTADVPNSGPTVASRTVTIVGKLVETACLALREQLFFARLLQPVYTSDEFSAACARHVRELGPLRATAQYEAPPHVVWDDAAFRGDAYGAYSWALYVAEVAVDTRTYEVTVTDFVALQEVGKVIHPLLAAGQIEGGVAQGIGFALSEHVAWKDGRMQNARMTDYAIPTASDLPRVRALFEAMPYPYGPAGAKGIGELPMDGPAPAIANAIHDALGVSVCRVPLTPEVILGALEEAGHE